MSEEDRLVSGSFDTNIGKHTSIWRLGKKEGV